jgi:protein subunit release factor B
MASRVLSVTIKDCEVQHFRSGGKGGQNQNKRDTGARVIHHPSGAVGESREHRTQLENKRAAFKRMAESAKFKIWINRELYGFAEVEREVQAAMGRTHDFKTEIKRDGKWVPEDGDKG